MKTYYAAYFRKSLIPFLLKKYWSVMVGVFIILVIYVSGLNYSQTTGEGILKDGVKGLSEYGPVQFGISSFLFLIVMGICFGSLNYNYARTKMIVGVEIDEGKKAITLFTRNLLGKLFRHTYRFHQIKMRNNGKDKSKDGLSFVQDIRCGVFIHNRIVVARFFIDHFTWPENGGLLNDIIRTVEATEQQAG